MFPMASASGSDIVCVELEDGIAPRDKAKARKHALALYDTQQANDGVERCCQTNENSHQIAGAALIYALNSWRHSARAAVRLSLKLSRE